MPSHSVHHPANQHHHAHTPDRPELHGIAIWAPAGRARHGAAPVPTDSLKALATGNIDANSQTLNDTLSSVAGGATETIVLVNDNSTGNDQIIARAGIDSIADLKREDRHGRAGHRGRLPAAAHTAPSRTVRKDVKFTPLPTDAAAAAFVAGSVDPVRVFAPSTTTAAGRAGSRAIAIPSSDPGRVAAQIAVPLPAGRELDVRRTPRFLAVRQQIEDLVRARHRRHLAGTNEGGLPA